MRYLLLFSLAFTISCQSLVRKNESEPTKSPSKALFLNKGQLPKIGLILGPGTFKAWAHVGVIKEFEKRGIQIHSIAGLEWGALMAALYSSKSTINELEWQLSKMKNTRFNYGSSIRQLRSEFQAAFGSSRIEGGKIPFFCPSLLLKNGKTAWWEKGKYSDALEKCMAFPPFSQAHYGWVADAFNVEEAAKKLRDYGAEVIVFVNVLARGNVLSSGQDSSQIIWWEGAQRMNETPKGVDWVIGIHTRKYNILDADARPSFVLFGQEFGAAAADKIASEYGF